jgi:hypothetical protein
MGRPRDPAKPHESARDIVWLFEAVELSRHCRTRVIGYDKHKPIPTWLVDKLEEQRPS